MEELKEILGKLTLEEKAGLCSGKDYWLLKSVERLGIPNIMVADGPHGLRKQPESKENLGVNVSKPSTCFPTACATASSWDRNLLHSIGQGIADECLKEKVSVILGPGANIKRSPLCGRNFEYFSEDPYLSGEIAAAFIEGVQSKGVGTSLKHFAANNQEDYRMTINAVIDERALREIYLTSFETAVKKAKPWTVMCSYNKLNGALNSENKWLLTDILRDEWGYEGLVMSDWGSVNERVEGVKAGLDLEMPGGVAHNDKKIVEAVNNGTLYMKDLDKAVLRVLELIKKASEKIKENYDFDIQKNHGLAREAAAQSAVLLKNNGNLLPLSKSAKIAVIGEMAKRPRYQGSGSSLINPSKLDNAYDSMKSQKIDFKYAQGYSYMIDAVDETLINEACDIAKGADVVVVFAGLTPLYESEGYDREHARLPENQNVLINRLLDVNPNIAVVLAGGSPVEMPWADKVNSILNMYLAGQAGGSAAVDLLFGDANPSGKLAETYPVKYSVSASSKYFPEGPRTVEYRESIYVGYRYFDTAKKPVLFPFGHGLSYAAFEYSDLSVSSENITDNDTLTVSFKIKNTGKTAGAEVAQLYVHDVESTVFKAEKELKGFEKIFLQPGEEKKAELTLDKRSFAYYSVKDKDWCVESGEYEILVGSSSRDIRLSKIINVTSDDKTQDYPADKLKGYYMKDGELVASDEAFTALYGSELPAKNRSAKELYTWSSTIDDMRGTLIGKIMYNKGMKEMKRQVPGDDENAILAQNMNIRMLPQAPLRNIVSMNGTIFTAEMADALLLMLNGKRIRGGFKLLKAMIRK